MQPRSCSCFSVLPLSPTGSSSHSHFIVIFPFLNILESLCIVTMKCICIQSKLHICSTALPSTAQCRSYLQHLWRSPLRNVEREGMYNKQLVWVQQVRDIGPKLKSTLHQEDVICSLPSPPLFCAGCLFSQRWYQISSTPFPPHHCSVQVAGFPRDPVIWAHAQFDGTCW